MATVTLLDTGYTPLARSLSPRRGRVSPRLATRFITRPFLSPPQTGEESVAAEDRCRPMRVVRKTAIPIGRLHAEIAQVNPDDKEIPFRLSDLPEAVDAGPPSVTTPPRLLVGGQSSVGLLTDVVLRGGSEGVVLTR